MKVFFAEIKNNQLITTQIPESVLFPKGQVLMGLNKFRRKIEKGKPSSRNIRGIAYPEFENLGILCLYYQVYYTLIKDKSKIKWRLIHLENIDIRRERANAAYENNKPGNWRRLLKLSELEKPKTN